MIIHHKGSLVYSDGKITTLQERRNGYPEIMFVPQEVYFGYHDGNHIRILPICEKLDAEAWLNAYLEVCRDTHSHVISCFYGVTYELGGFHNNHSIGALADGNIVRFYCRPRVPRLYCVKRDGNTDAAD